VSSMPRQYDEWSLIESAPRDEPVIVAALEADGRTMVWALARHVLVDVTEYSWRWPWVVDLKLLAWVYSCSKKRAPVTFKPTHWKKPFLNPPLEFLR
jgi:hypothetical protein